MMTKEAKVGLLLGLAFIVAIALVLRGVHQEQADQFQETVALNPVQTTDVVGTVDQAVSDLSGQVRQLGPDATAERFVAAAEPQRHHVVPPIGIRPEDAEAESRLPRSVVNLSVSEEAPAPADMLVDEEPVTELRSLSDVTKPVPTVGTRFVQDIPSAEAMTPPNGAIDRAVDRMNSQMNPVAPQREIEQVAAGPKPAERVYVVAKGDDLSRVALKAYGPSEGKRWVNVKKIYEANRGTLASIDQVFPGQRLQIPALANNIGTVSQMAANQPARTETVVKTRLYTVKKNDSLWRIAQEQLGDGKRFTEIAKLNDKLLSDEDSIKVGMKLKLPAK